MSKLRTKIIGPLPTLLALALAIGPLLGGCGSTIASMPVIGEPEDTPKRPDVQAPYPEIQYAAPTPQTTPMTAVERKKLEDELAAEREKQNRHLQELKAADDAAASGAPLPPPTTAAAPKPKPGPVALRPGKTKPATKTAKAGTRAKPPAKGPAASQTTPAAAPR